MKQITLTGELGNKFGRSHRFNVKSPAEAIRALIANFPGFEKELIESQERNVGYKVITDGDELESVDDINNPVSREIIIAPVIMGSSAGARIIIGAVLIAAAVIAAPFTAGTSLSFIPTVVGSLGVSLALGGVAQLLSPQPKANEPQERPENTPSYSFNGPVNTTAQGQPVSIGYGRMIIGSAIVSAGIVVDQLQRGYIEKQVEMTSTINATGTEDNYASTPPTGYHRKELLDYFYDDGLSTNVWVWKFYYYETVLELA